MAAPDRQHGDSLGPLIHLEGECDLCGELSEDLTEDDEDGMLCPACIALDVAT